MNHTFESETGTAITDGTLDLLEFNRLLEIISGLANSEASQRAVLKMRPLNSGSDIEKRLGRIQEIMRMSQEGRPLGLSRFADISEALKKVRTEGAVLEPYELSDFIPVLKIMSGICSQMMETDGAALLREITDSLTGFPDILNILERSIDSEGNILDSASALLSGFRADIRMQEKRIRKKLDGIVREERVSVFLQDDFITTRSGRWVIPVRMDSKGQVPGVVHDVSKSGETAFIEPLAIINLVNELENLIAEQKAEEIRILREISARIRESAEEIGRQYKSIVYLDMLNCIAKFSETMKMQAPLINDSGTVSISGARHPLLMLSFIRTGRGWEVVPLDVNLGGENTLMVITGSNAGGKTVAIKTIGLLQLMALCGMPVPADSSSSFPFVRNLLVDIGDEQSIESNLSTFSAHVFNISGILKNAGTKTLVLIDELGTGTDPDEGTALACAVLKDLRKSGALVFATTHLTGIKGFVHMTDGMLNASMEFDRKTLTPLYRLRIGEPGQSHALDTARRYGMPDSIIDSAKAMMGSLNAEFDRLIGDLNEKRSRYEKGLEELEKRMAEAEEGRRRLKETLSAAEARREEIIEGTYREASGIVADIKRQMYNLLEDARNRDKAERRKIIREVEKKQEEIEEKLRESDAAGSPPIEQIKEGDFVFVRSLGCDASVVEVNRKSSRLKLRAGSMEIEVPASDIGYKKGKPVETMRDAVHTINLDETVQSAITLVGLRVDEALSRLEPFLNHASLAGLSEAIVVHGIGAGILMKAVREHLKGHPLVKSFRSGEQREGGSGVTIVTMA